jgi:hypothetical protein
MLAAPPQPYRDRMKRLKEASMNPLHTGHSEGQDQHSGHRGHGWMMIGCLAFLVVALALVATGAASAAFLFAAIGCMAMMGVMMWMMMGAMSGGGK